MKSAIAFRLRLAALVLGVCALASDHRSGRPIQTNDVRAKESAELKAVHMKAFRLAMQQQYSEAIVEYEKARELALAEKNYRQAISILNNIAGSQFAQASFQAATRNFNLALAEAKYRNLPELETSIAYNLASLQLSVGLDQQAHNLIHQYPLDGTSMNQNARLDCFLLQANIYTRVKDETRTRQAFQRALAEAEKPPPTQVAPGAERLKPWSEATRELRRAKVFAVMGQDLGRLDHLKEAEAFALEAFRIRAVFRDKARLGDAIRLTMLNREMGNFAAARHHLGAARNLEPGNKTPILHFLIDREDAFLSIAEKKFSTAIPALRSALAEARRWRMQIMPTDSAYLNFESYLTTEIHKGFLNTIAEPQFPLAQKGLAEESFWVAEEARFASMRAAQFPNQDFASRFPTEYWQKLARAQALETAAFQGAKINQKEKASLIAEMDLMESAAGLSIPNVSSSSELNFRQWQKALKSDEVVFSYHLGEPYSLAWTVTSKSIALRRIASKNQLAKWVEEFRLQVLDPSRNGMNSTGMELSRQLFGDYLRTHRTTPFWTMVLDQELSSLPVAALPADEARKRYLVEDHSLRLLPSCIFLQGEVPKDWKRSATGIGDPVYNKADQRVKVADGTNLNFLQLNRLPASAREIHQSLSTLSVSGWSTTENTGMTASAETIRRALSQSPDILHISAHFVPQQGTSEMLSIALSPVSGRVGISLFSPHDLNSVRTSSKLVVLSGCSTSTGKIVPSIAINGLSRAFLIAGANMVLATLWPTVDTDGPIFPVFYQNLIQQKWSPRAAAESLRAAQLQMIRQGGWTSKPSYWAAYLAISKG